MKFLKNQRGLTLIETIVALVLVLLLVTAFAGALVVGLQSEVDVDMSLKAGDMAETIMEYLSERDIEEDFLNEENEDYNETFSVFFENKDEANILGDALLYFYENSVDAEDSLIIITEEDLPDGLVEVEILLKWEERGQDWTFDLVSRLRK